LKHSSSIRALTYLSLFGLAITVPLLLLVGALLLQSASVERAQLEARVLQVLDALVNDIDRDLDRDITILHTLATSQALASADWPTFYDQAKAGLQGRAYLVLIDANGRQLVNTYVPYGEQPAMTGDSETLRRILQTKAPVVSNLFVSRVVKKPVFNVSIPILQDGQVRYVMSLGLLPDDLVALLTSQNLGSEWVMLIWDANGVILARSRDNSRYLGTPLPQNMRERAQRAVVRTVNLDAVDVSHAAAHSQISGWGVGVNIPYSLVTEQMRNSLLLWGAAAVLAITIAFAVGVFFARQITTPLSVAAKAAAAFGHGEPFPLTGSRLKEADAFLVTLKDAQEAREKLTEEVKHSRDWLQTTLASIGDGVIATDQKGRITFLNGVSQALTGWAQEEAKGRPLEQVFVIHNEETGAPAENPVSKALREGRIVGLANHTKLRSKHGLEIPIDDSAAPIRDADGNVIGVVLVFRDVTERKEAEDALNKSMAELRRANEDLNQFAFAASHDLQEPLRMITSYSQLLLRGYRGQLDDEAETCITFITDGTKRMRELLADLLAYTQLTGDEEEALASVDLHDAVQTAVDNCKAAIDDAGASVTSNPLPIVPGHKPRFVQLFQNLISNALKYRRDCAPQIHISAERQNGTWRVAVKDNGMGIDPEYHEQIFGVFKRLHGKTIPGTGIGLAICKRVVERYGGKIWVASQPGQGATFYLTLPAASKGGAAHE
jgi:PAS domain S-box-containing protein